MQFDVIALRKGIVFLCPVCFTLAGWAKWSIAHVVSIWIMLRVTSTRCVILVSSLGSSSIPYHTLTCRAMLGCAWSCRAMSCHDVTCCTVPCCAMTCYAIPSHAMSCHTMPSHVVFCAHYVNSEQEVSDKVTSDWCTNRKFPYILIWQQNWWMMLVKRAPESCKAVSGCARACLYSALLQSNNHTCTIVALHTLPRGVLSMVSFVTYSSARKIQLIASFTQTLR